MKTSPVLILAKTLKVVNMPRYTCDLLKNEITFFQNQVQSCCSSKLGPIYLPDYKGEKIDWKNVLKIKLDTLKNMQNGNIPDNCKDCFNLHTSDKKRNLQKVFSRLIISHWVQCNCSCIYCARNQYSEGKITRKPQKSSYYDMLPILKEMYSNKLLDTKGNLFVDFQGGDISVLKEFDTLLKELMKNNAGYIRFTTNNIIYHPLITKLFKQGKAELMTSLDSGCRETYKKLKRVDKFNDTVQNLKKYKEDAPNAFIFVKYITVQGINDNLNEVNKFLDLMFDIKIPAVSFEIDYRDIMMNPDKRFDIPKHYYDLYEIFKKRCNETGTKLILFTHTENILKQGYFGGK